ncbi:MAG TPA: O-antigen ligase family protein [Bryobacteraceae bacterium]|jgi:O-antigen ligase|nr:O-antigen ligase family protein [Bryobacteraceae bacterium]
MTVLVRRSPEPAHLIALVIGLCGGLVALAPTPLHTFAVMAVASVLLTAWWSVRTPQRWLMLLFTALLLTPPLPVELGGSGPHIGLPVAAFGLFIGLLRAREWHAPKGLLSLAFAAFIAVLIGSTAFALLYSGPVIAAASLARIVLLSISLYVFLYTYNGPRAPGSDALGEARYVFLAALVAALFACVDFYYQFPAPAGYAEQFIWLTDGVFRRAQGLFYDASTLGNFCVFFLVMILAALVRPREQAPCSRVVLGLGGVVFSAALILSYSRASLAGLLVAILALLVTVRVRIWRTLVAAAACLTMAALIASFTMPALSEMYWLRVRGSVEYIWSSPDGILSGRLTSWGTLLDFLAREPWYAILGIGYKTLPYSDVAGQSVVADNTYLGLLVETGILGLAAFAVLNATLLRTAFRAARSPRPKAAFFGTWIFCFWCGQLVQMLSGDLMTYWRVLPIYFWVLATSAREAGAEA